MNISNVIEEFKKQKIQSEAEIRSKLIVPLLELLKYPKSFRAEEFPVYGYEGGKPLRPKSADFLQFTSDEFGKHRGKSELELEWVYNHSLLVFEAKKPTEKILIKGQPVFYSAWTKSVAYMISNGVHIEGYIVNANYSDTRVFSCKVEDIPSHWESINKLNYNNIIDLKKTIKDARQMINIDCYENYKNAMRVRCSEELDICLDRKFKIISIKSEEKLIGEEIKFSEIIDYSSKVITSEPGGGKSYLSWMMMSEYLKLCGNAESKIPVLLQGKYYGKVFKSIIDGIYEECNWLVPSLTKDQIENRLREGGFIIIFDALDEVLEDKDELFYQLIQLSKNTKNSIIVTSRVDYYKKHPQTGFNHYSLELLEVKQIQEMLSYYCDNKSIALFHNIPKRVLELMRIPLFLNMFISISKRSGMNRMPSNYSELFQEFIDCEFTEFSFYNKNIAISMLGKYAVQSLKNGECSEYFFELLHTMFKDGNIEKICEEIYDTGLISNSRQGIKFYHKTFQEFFVAIELSKWDEEKLEKWLNESLFQEKYQEIIVFLTGIISNKHKQNYILDYLEKNNLNLFIRALKSRRKFVVLEETLNNKYVEKYFEQVLNTYDNLIKTHFSNIMYHFDGYDLNGKICLHGSMDTAKKTISFRIFSGELDEQRVCINSFGYKDANLEEYRKNKALMTSSGVHTMWYFNLEMLSYGLDSSREIAIDIIQNQLKKMMDKKVVFDSFVDVLLAEDIETTLKFMREELGIQNSENLTLYSNDITALLEEMDNICSNNPRIENIRTMCLVLKKINKDTSELLDIKPDLTPIVDEKSFRVWDRYSEKQLVEKVRRILSLTNKAIQDICTKILPVLSTVYINYRKIGVVYRNSDIAGVSLLSVENNMDECAEAIIEYREDSISAYPLDEYYLAKLKSIAKSERDILSAENTHLHLYFKEEIFHQFIYREVQRLLKELFTTV